MNKVPNSPKPPWLRVRLSVNEKFAFVKKTALDSRLHTVCEEANCPNAVECWNAGTATFLILGDRCTRNCNFCAVAHGPAGAPDGDEPERVARAVREMKLSYVVITSVTRDDLADGGADHFAKTVESVRSLNPGIMIEVLVPDFQGALDAIQRVVGAKPDVLAHNVETIPRLYARVRPGADYRRSLQLSRTARSLDPAITLKSGLMLGLGESPEEVREVLADLRDAGCELLTLGQYLQPTRNHLPVDRFVPPDEFDAWRIEALEAGFLDVSSGPLVRSSFRARDMYYRARNGKGNRYGRA
jgi:lipoic acid synthetase